jgi:hypothetical protein
MGIPLNLPPGNLGLDRVELDITRVHGVVPIASRSARPYTSGKRQNRSEKSLFALKCTNGGTMRIRHVSAGIHRCKILSAPDFKGDSKSGQRTQFALQPMPLTTPSRGTQAQNGQQTSSGG